MAVAQSVIDRRLGLQRQIRSIESQLSKAAEMITAYRALHSNVSFAAPPSHQSALKKRLDDMERAHRDYVGEMGNIRTHLQNQLVELT